MRRLNDWLDDVAPMLAYLAACGAWLGIILTAVFCLAQCVMNNR